MHSCSVPPAGGKCALVSGNDQLHDLGRAVTNFHAHDIAHPLLVFPTVVLIALMIFVRQQQKQKAEGR